MGLSLEPRPFSQNERTGEVVLQCVQGWIMTTTVTYRDASRHLQSQAEAEYAARDLRQASEKGWGSAAQIVKALCADRGWRHDHHALLFEAVRALRVETGDEELYVLFSVAHNQHINFYENWLDDWEVRRDLDEVRRFVDKVETLLNVETP